MVLIDSAFIIELFRTYAILTPFTHSGLMHDLRLVENQLPFFILRELYLAAFKVDPDHIINTNTAPSFTDIACAWLIVDKARVEVDANSNEAVGSSCCHLLDLVRTHHLPSHQITEEEADQSNDTDVVCPSATSLYEAGVKFCFVGVDSSTSLLDIRFDEKKGILTIPKLLMHGPTESLFRNMIAFEQRHYPYQTYFAHYHFFLDCLINSWEDVQLLAKAGIIENWLGNEKDVSDLINAVGKNVSIIRGQYYYADITNQLVAYCNRRWNRYKATLKHTYFRHPWAVLSVIYAVILLVLTIIQVVAGVLAVPHVMN